MSLSRRVLFVPATDDIDRGKVKVKFESLAFSRMF
jgi:hypothetical protein